MARTVRESRLAWWVAVDSHGIDSFAPTGRACVLVRDVFVSAVMTIVFVFGLCDSTRDFELRFLLLDYTSRVFRCETIHLIISRSIPTLHGLQPYMTTISP